MTIVYLDSAEDPRLAPYQQLASAALPGERRHIIAEGRFLVERLAASRFVVESILTDASRAATLPEEMARQTTVFVLPAHTINQLVGFDFHRGMLACGLRGESPGWDELLPPPPAPVRLVICWNVADPANLGGIVRNAVAFGADAVLLGPGCADPFSRRVLRASMGAVLQVAIAACPPREIDALGQLVDRQNVTLVATVLAPEAEPLARVEPIGRLGLVIGNEGFGLPEAAVGICQRKVTIPLQPGVDSLNAAVASGIVLYHFSQR